MPDERCLETIMALPARGRNRLSDAGAGRSEQSARVRHHLSLALEDEHCLCLPKLQPSCFVDLAIMVGDVSAAVLEEKEVDSFVKAHPLRVSVGTHIPVLDLDEPRPAALPWLRPAGTRSLPVLFRTNILSLHLVVNVRSTLLECLRTVARHTHLSVLPPRPAGGTSGASTFHSRRGVAHRRSM